jgi:hypothetical protein
MILLSLWKLPVHSTTPGKPAMLSDDPKDTTPHLRTLKTTDKKGKTPSRKASSTASRPVFSVVTLNLHPLTLVEVTLTVVASSLSIMELTVKLLLSIAFV